MSPSKSAKRFDIRMLVPITFMTGFVGLFVYAAIETGNATDVAETFLGHLRAGELEAAYAMMHPNGRGSTDLADFAATYGALRDAGELSWQETEGPGSLGRACVIGHLDVRGHNLGIRVYLLERDGELQVLDVITYDSVVPEGPFICGGV